MGKFEFKHYKTVNISDMQNEIQSMRQILSFLEDGKVGSHVFSEKKLLQYCKSLVNGEMFFW